MIKIINRFGVSNMSGLLPVSPIVAGAAIAPSENAAKNESVWNGRSLRVTRAAGLPSWQGREPKQKSHVVFDRVQGRLAAGMPSAETAREPKGKSQAVFDRSQGTPAAGLPSSQGRAPKQKGHMVFDRSQGTPAAGLPSSQGRAPKQKGHMVFDRSQGTPAAGLASSQGRAPKQKALAVFDRSPGTPAAGLPSSQGRERAQKRHFPPSRIPVLIQPRTQAASIAQKQDLHHSSVKTPAAG